MSPSVLLKQAKQRLDTLTPDRLRVANEFLAFLEERERAEATAELLEIPGFLEAMDRAEAEVRAGKLTPVGQLRRQ